MKTLKECKEWIDAYKAKHHRSLRVLHIGNIANNAYNNAKLLKKVGIDSDVICYDYYHIMGCPEWEDADFENNIENDFFPNWSKVLLNGFNRPEWFVQGSMLTSIRYLIAKHRGRTLALKCWKHLLRVEQRLAGSYFMNILRCLFVPVRSFRHGSWLHGGLLPRYGIVPPVRIVIAVIQLFIAVMDTFLWLAGGLLKMIFLVPLWSRKMISDEDTVPVKYNIYERCMELMGIYCRRFGSRGDRLDYASFDSYAQAIMYWRSLFRHYDIVVGYSTDGMFPLLAGKRPYCCLEHGTLRAIPYENTDRGRLACLSYGMSDHVFVTNSDCMDTAKKLAGDSVTFINHPYDEDHGVDREGWDKLRESLIKALDSDFLVFFPTRQDWVTGTGYADKANDVLFNAFIRLRNSGCKIGLICCEWGSNVNESKRLLQEAGLDRFVLWQKPMGTVQFERMGLACDIVADQFMLGSFGGVMFKTMAVGIPVCTYLNKEDLVAQYGDVPPVVNCRTEDEIVAGLTEVMLDRNKLKELSKLSRAWIKKHYNSDDTIICQVNAFRDCIENNKNEGEECYETVDIDRTSMA